MNTYFNRFEFSMTKKQALACSHPGPCDKEVKELSELPIIRRQLDKISPDSIRAELAEYGEWDEIELSDDKANRQRILWIAAGNITHPEG